MIRFQRRTVSRELASLYRHLNARTLFEEDCRKHRRLSARGTSPSPLEKARKERQVDSARGASPSAPEETRQECHTDSTRDASPSVPQDPAEPRP